MDTRIASVTVHRTMANTGTLPSEAAARAEASRAAGGVRGRQPPLHRPRDLQHLDNWLRRLFEFNLV
jgi:hypothetical protein